MHGFLSPPHTIDYTVYTPIHFPVLGFFSVRRSAVDRPCPVCTLSTTVRRDHTHSLRRREKSESRQRALTWLPSLCFSSSTSPSPHSPPCHGIPLRQRIYTNTRIHTQKGFQGLWRVEEDDKDGCVYCSIRSNSKQRPDSKASPPPLLHSTLFSSLLFSYSLLLSARFVLFFSSFSSYWRPLLPAPPFLYFAHRVVSITSPSAE